MGEVLISSRLVEKVFLESDDFFAPGGLILLPLPTP